VLKMALHTDAHKIEPPPTLRCDGRRTHHLPSDGVTDGTQRAHHRRQAAPSFASEQAWNILEQKGAGARLAQEALDLTKELPLGIGQPRLQTQRGEGLAWEASDQ
jgi:hypothetical protein